LIGRVLEDDSVLEVFHESSGRAWKSHEVYGTGSSHRRETLTVLRAELFLCTRAVPMVFQRRTTNANEKLTHMTVGLIMLNES
jgi:hypothetical protein